MDFLWRTDWGRLFAPEMSLPEILVRGTLIYLALCLLLRVVLKRQAGKVSLSDLLVVSIVAGVCRNPLVRDAYSVTDGVLVVATMLSWSFALDWLSYHVPLIHKLLHAPPVALIQDGQVLRENLRRELMTESQLRSKLRGEGVREPAEAAEAWLEGDGQVSVIKKNEPQPARPHEGALDPGNGQGYQRNGRLRAAAPGGDGVPAEPALPDGAALRAFLEAARELEEQVARHRQAIAEHQQGIAEVQEVLGRFGFRIKSPTHGRRSKQAKSPPDREAPGSPSQTATEYDGVDPPERMLPRNQAGGRPEA